MKISIASGKGGTGKSTLSTNLAAYLSESDDIVLVDLDVEEPNSGLFIQGDPVRREVKYKMIPEWKGDCSLCGICQESCNFHAVMKLGTQIMVFPELCHTCYACSELCPEFALPMAPLRIGELHHVKRNSLAFIESRLDIGQEQAVPLIAQTIQYVDKWFSNDILKIYDAPPGTSCPVIEALKNADFVILVTEPTPFGLHDLKLAVETTRALHKPFGVVINRYGIGNEDVVLYCRAENIPVLAKIPNDRRIAEMYSRGQLLYQAIPEVRHQMEYIIDHIRSVYAGAWA